MATDCKFIIYGNQEKKLGNPIPYFRQTQASSRFNKNAKRYHAWKDYVRKVAQEQGFRNVIYRGQSTIIENPKKIKMDMMIYFGNKTHGDSDNIFKGIADSLFPQDKTVCGSFDFEYDNTNPRVEISISYIF